MQSDTKNGLSDVNNPSNGAYVVEITWLERDDNDDSRRGTMYCFKNCDVNQN